MFDNVIARDEIYVTLMVCVVSLRQIRVRPGLQQVSLEVFAAKP